MSKLSPLQTAKRAARQNPAFQTARIYVVAIDNEEPAYTALGELQYDEADTTLGYVDRTREAVMTIGSYVGACLITVLTEVPPNSATLIETGGVFHQVDALHSSDVLATSVTFRCTALAALANPVIREPSP